MDKLFITKKCTQRKALHTFKTDVFELRDNKNIGKLFSKYDLFSLDQANSSYNTSQILILQYFIPRDSLPPLPSLSNFLLLNWNTSSTQSSSFVLHQFSYFILPYSNTHHNYWIYQTICQARPIKFFIELYAKHSPLLVKHANYKKGESLRDPSLSNLDNIKNNKSIFNTKCAEFSEKW